MNDLSRVGAYVKRTDPAMYRRITSIVGCRKNNAVGAYVELVDPDMFDRIAARDPRVESVSMTARWAVSHASY